jgi:hypothetical protein
MTTALQINAEQTIINGQGLGVSGNLLAQISTFQSHQPIQLIANIFNNVNNSGNAAPNLLPVVSTVGTGAGLNAWAIDFWSSNITPATSSNVYTYGVLTTPIYDPNPAHWTTGTDGGTIQPIIGYNHTPIISTTSFSHTVNVQAQLPFTNGLAEFANVYTRAYGWSVQHFDTVSSTHLLTGRTYGQSGIGYTGPVDLVTAGINTYGGLLSNAVSNWGTMYDIRNMNSIADVYVFGQNLLNQGFGTLGNLATDMTNAGLNIYNLKAVPQPVTSTTYSPGTITYGSSIGQIEIPSINAQTTTTVVTGSSADVLTNIYSTITGSNLAAIVDATGITTASGTTPTTLSDYLDLSKITYPATYSGLNALGIYTLAQLGEYLQVKVGQGYFTSWATLATFLKSLEVPSLPHLSASVTAGTPLLSSATINSVYNRTGTGSGVFTNTVLTDYLGSVAGMPYTDVITVLNSNYNQVVPASLTTAVQSLDSAVSSYINNYNAWVTANTGGSGPDIGPVTSAVGSVNSILGSLPSSDKLTQCQQSYYSAITKLPNEVALLSKAGVVFDSGSQQALESFASQIGSVASDKDTHQTYQFFANIITNDIAGDTIRAVIAETINTQLLLGTGIKIRNDPEPSQIIYNAEQQNIPISTYITRNQ